MKRGGPGIGDWPLRSQDPRQVFQHAVALHQRGRIDEAAQLYEAVLKLDRNQFDSLHNLGVIRFQQERIEEATRLLRRALLQNPRSVDAHNNLGNALQKGGRVQEAVGHYERALALAPDHVQAHSNLGAALRILNRHEDAVLHLERALALDPNHAQVHGNLGIALVTLNRHEDAAPHLELAVRSNPGDSRTRCLLAQALLAIRRNRLALWHFEKTLAQSPDDIDALTGQGRALERLGRTEEAREVFRRVIALKPDCAEAFNGLGETLEFDGRLDEARQALERAIELAPRQGRFHRALAEAKRFQPDDPHLAAMEELARDIAALPANDQMELHFALGKALDDVGQRDAAFRHLLAGNAIKRRSNRYDEPATLDKLARIEAVFTAALMRDKAGLGDPSPVPVFVLGMPRSGTTLAEQILVSHPVVFGAGERDDFTMLINHDIPGFPDSVPALSRADLERLATDYLKLVGQDAAPGTLRITDKMPANFCNIGLIHLALPNARIIHTRRDPVDTCLSLFSKLFTGGQPFAYDLGELGRYYRAYERLMAHWRQVLPAGVMIEVQYEEVVADLEGQARRMIAHCGLDWDEACLAFHQTERPVLTASMLQVRQPIYTSSVGRWRAYGALLDPLLEALGIDRPAASG